MAESKYMVCVRCLTYNHSRWIMDAMNGFCHQETSFPFVCTIVDDNSSDGEQDVINRYLESNFNLTDNTIAKSEETLDYKSVFAQHKINKNCFFVVYFLKYNHYQKKKSKWPYFLTWSEQSNYVAMCEGDDYWTDAHKLQIQVDYLESHLKHSMCIHAYRRDLYQGNDVSRTDIYKYPCDVDIIPDKDVLNGTGMFGATASIVYRSEAIDDYPEWAVKAPVGDRPLKLVLFARGHIAYLNKVMSVYRVGVPGSWTIRENKNREKEKSNRRKFIQLLIDFDNWTNQKYHYLVEKAIYDYKRACMKNDFVFVIRTALRPVITFFKH